MVKPAPDAPLCVCSRATGERGWKGPVGGKDLEATVSSVYNGFVYHAQAGWVGFKIDQGGPPASIENYDVAANFNGVGAIGGSGGRARRGDKKCGPWTKLCTGCTKIVACCLGTLASIRTKQSTLEEFRMFKAV